MKKMLLLPAILFWRSVQLLALFLALYSCNSDFNINGPSYENENVYVLNCILRSDSTTQYATLSKNVYAENGAEPTTSNPEQFIQGADIKIFHNNSVFVMKDTTIQLTISGNITYVHCYYVKNMKLIGGKTVQIEAKLSNGKILKSSTKVPQIIIDYRFFSTIFPQTLQGGFKTQFSYNWDWVGMTNILNLPRLEIFYQKYENGSYVDKKIQFRLVYNISRDASTGGPKNMDVIDPSFNKSCFGYFTTITKSLRKISGNDPNKSNYIINKVIFSVTGLDPELAKFCFANNTFQESFSIKIRQTDYSNIEGGYGIFGAYYKFSKPLSIDSSYIRSFGYCYDPRQK